MAAKTESEPRELRDRWGRVARDLRVSLTEKCTLRCRYCMPAEGLPAARTTMDTDEVVRLIGIAVDRLGVSEIRLTGGEPLVRRDLESIAAQLHRNHPGTPLALTTNGLGLDKRAAGLLAAGVRRVNISLDTVDPELFAHITRRDRLTSVLAGIDAAIAAGMAPVKVNAVVTSETAPGLVPLVRWALGKDLQLRLIESMPLDADRSWTPESVVGVDAMLATLGEEFTVTPIGRDDPSAPAELFRLRGRERDSAGEVPEGTIGIIGSMTRSFCAQCDRTRLTAEGTVRSCLFSDTEVDLLTAMRSGATDSEVADLWVGAAWNKSAGHDPLPLLVGPTKSMGAIGG